MTDLAQAIQNACEIARRDERRKFREYLERKKMEAEDELHNLETEYQIQDSEDVSCAAALVSAYEQIIDEFFT